MVDSYSDSRYTTHPQLAGIDDHQKRPKKPRKNGEVSHRSARKEIARLEPKPAHRGKANQKTNTAIRKVLEDSVIYGALVYMHVVQTDGTVRVFHYGSMGDHLKIAGAACVQSQINNMENYEARAMEPEELGYRHLPNMRLSTPAMHDNTPYPSHRSHYEMRGAWPDITYTQTIRGGHPELPGAEVQEIGLTRIDLRGCDDHVQLRDSPCHTRNTYNAWLYDLLYNGKGSSLEEVEDHFSASNPSSMAIAALPNARPAPAQNDSSEESSGSDASAEERKRQQRKKKDRKKEKKRRRESRSKEDKPHRGKTAKDTLEPKKHRKSKASPRRENTVGFAPVETNTGEVLVDGRFLCEMSDDDNCMWSPM